MRVFFRTDASLQIGSGHVMRCLTLADELRQRGADVRFVCREHPGHLIALIEEKGYTVVRLSQPGAAYTTTDDDVVHAPLLGVSWSQDAAETVSALEGMQPNWLIVDHYSLDRRWEQSLRPYVDKIMVIDDLADRSHDCDLLLDQNLYHGMETRYDTLVPAGCTKLLGPRNVLLRPEFAAARSGLRRRDGVIRRVLVFFGGMDLTNETGKALQALEGIAGGQFKVDVVVGGGNPHKEQIRSFCLSCDSFSFHCQIDNMAELMAAADLAIGAGGSTTWERCALGLPALVMSIAENQSELASYCAERGLFFLMGDRRFVSSRTISEILRIFLLNPENLRSYSSRCLEEVDASGLQRVAKVIAPFRIVMRQAAADDCDVILEWRNAEETRKHIFNPEKIDLQTHRQWFSKIQNNPDRIILIGECSSKPVGVVRYDISGEVALISVYLVPGGQGQGAGTELLRSGTRWLKKNRPGVSQINAEILSSNIASKRAFEHAGYIEHHAIYRESL